VRPHFLWGSEFLDESVDLFGFILALFGVWIRMVARDWKLEHGSKGLVTIGPYAVVRNPMYVGSLIIGLGLCAIIGDLPFLVLFLTCFAFVHVCSVRSEELFLSQKWPADFSAYRSSVPAWVPSVAAIVGAYRQGAFRFLNLKRSFAKESDSLVATVVGACLLEAHEDYLVEGWSAARVEVLVFVGLAVAFVIFRMVCLNKELRRWLSTG